VFENRVLRRNFQPKRDEVKVGKFSTAQLAASQEGFISMELDR
jgi:hypothetical protein